MTDEEFILKVANMRDLAVMLYDMKQFLIRKRQFESKELSNVMKTNYQVINEKAGKRIGICSETIG